MTAPSLRAPLLAALMLLGLSHQPCAAKPPEIEPLLATGQLEEAESTLSDHLAVEPDDDLARFQLGTVQFLRAVEHLTQTGVRYGARTEGLWLPFLRAGAAAGNKQDAEVVRYEDLREMIEEFQTEVQQAEQTLSKIDSEDLHWDLNFDKVAVDLDGDQKIGRSERLDVLFRVLMNRRQGLGAEEPLIAGFDSADVYWLRGYCQAVMALADLVLAYDQQELFERTAHYFFARPDTDFASKREAAEPPRPRVPFDVEDVSDVIAAVHLMSFKLREPGRLRDAQQRLLRMVELSRQSWALIQAEEDNHLEWIPNANQESVITDLRVGPEQVEAWQTFLSEAEAVLRGDKLVPFWRSGFEDGVNIHRVLTDPRDFDLVLWVQGTAALPYLERGELSTRETWRQLQRVFRGNFLGFALWVN